MVPEVVGVRLTAEMGLPTIFRDSEDAISIQETAETTGVGFPKLGLSSTQIVKKN